MLLPLMGPQLLETAVSLSAIVGAADPEAVVLDTQLNRIHMTIDIGGVNDRLAAAGPGAWGALNGAGHRR